MKVTALIPDEIVDEVSAEAQGKNLTESLVIALKEWLALKRLDHLHEDIEQKPLEFQRGFTAANVRKLNRRR